ncbi:MAG: hypothetical protein ACO24D_16725 [bacterium]
MGTHKATRNRRDNMNKRTPAQVAALFINLHAEDMINITGNCSFDDLRSEGDRLIAEGHDSYVVDAAVYNVAMLKGIEAK